MEVIGENDTFNQHFPTGLEVVELKYEKLRCKIALKCPEIWPWKMKLHSFAWTVFVYFVFIATHCLSLRLVGFLEKIVTMAFYAEFLSWRTAQCVILKLWIFMYFFELVRQKKVIMKKENVSNVANLCNKGQTGEMTKIWVLVTILIKFTFLSVYVHRTRT